MTEEQVRQIIREELASFALSDRYAFQKHLQLFDGRNIQVARGTGTKIATAANQKLGFFGTTPVVQPIGFSATADLTYNNAEMNMLNALWSMAQTLGLLSLS